MLALAFISSMYKEVIFLRTVFYMFVQKYYIIPVYK